MIQAASQRTFDLDGCRQAGIEECVYFASRIRTPIVRSLSDFALGEIALPRGLNKGRRFNFKRQPWVGLWFGAIDSGNWRRYVLTGPTQSGKSLAGVVIPVTYSVFELHDDAILAAPDFGIIGRKWHKDFLPVIRLTRYAELLPTVGAGSKGGRFLSMSFRDAGSLQFMSGKQGDEGRSAEPGRFLAITEFDKLDESSARGREADKITQLESRTDSYADAAEILCEGTVTTVDGRTWTEYQNGTASKIVLPCPHCGQYVTPEREHLVGWKDADDIIEARSKATYICPSCEKAWSERERRQANYDAKLIHKGQTIDGSGNVTGDLPPTDTLGFRYSAVNNLLQTAAYQAAKEWRAARTDEEEGDAERGICNFLWAIPWKRADHEHPRLDSTALTRRTLNIPRGVVPEATEFVAVGVDLGKFLGHWTVASAGDSRIHVPDYGCLEVKSRELGIEKALWIALEDLKALCETGWAMQDGHRVMPSEVWIDCQYKGGIVDAFCHENGHPFYPAMGYGSSSALTTYYRTPTQRTRDITLVGNEYHVRYVKSEGVYRREVNADHWKLYVHERLHVPKSAPGAMTWFHATTAEHLSFVKHLTAEEQRPDFDKKRGRFLRWHVIRSNNHWLDATYNACAALHLAGFRLKLQEEIKEAAAVAASKPRSATRPTRRRRFRSIGGRSLATFARSRYE